MLANKRIMASCSLASQPKRGSRNVFVVCFFLSLIGAMPAIALDLETEWGDRQGNQLDLPGETSLLLPRDQIATNLPIYIWKHVPNATEYVLQVWDTSSSPSSPKINKIYTSGEAKCTVMLNQCQVSPPIALAIGSATCILWPVNSEGFGPMAVMDFTVDKSKPEAALLLNPRGYWPTNTPTYRWRRVPNSTYYYLGVNDSAGKKIDRWYTASEAGCDSFGSTCSITPSTTIADGPAVWWIQTWNETGYGPSSEVMKFYVGLSKTVPGAATLKDPSTTIADATPTYTWIAVPAALFYRLWVEDSEGLKIKEWYADYQAGCASGTGICSVRPYTSLANGKAAWWIQTSNVWGHGDWSSRMDFTVNQLAPPGVATLISPSGTITSSSPSYVWKAVPNAASYLLWVDDSSSRGKIDKSYTASESGCGSGTGTCSVTPATSLANGSAAWWIDACNAAGCGPWSAQMTFNVNSTPELTTDTWAGTWSCKEPRYPAMIMSISGKGLSSVMTATYQDPATETYTIKATTAKTASGTYIWTCPSCGSPGVWNGTWSLAISGVGFSLTRTDSHNDWVGVYACTRTTIIK